MVLRLGLPEPLGCTGLYIEMERMTAFADECRALWQGRRLLWVMTRREIEARHAGTAVGVLWSYIQPLLTVAAFYLVFDVVFAMRMGGAEGARSHGAGMFLIVGMLPWMAFSDAVSRGMNSLLEAGSMLQKNPLPPVLFPMRSVLASSLVFGPLMVLVAMLYVVANGGARAALALPVLWLGQLLLSAALAYALAILTAALRDVAQVVAFMLSVGVYLSPILFPVTMFPEGWRWVLWLNPMACYVVAYQSVMLYGEWPALHLWLIALVWLVAVAVALSVLVRRSRDQLVDWL